MDHFGIGPALQALLRMYSASARGTGRTKSLIESVRNGDRIITSSLQAQRELRELLGRTGRVVDVVVMNASDAGRAMDLAPCAGRTLFDHTWVEQFYAQALIRAMRDIDGLQQHASRAADLMGIAEIRPRPDTKYLHF